MSLEMFYHAVKSDLKLKYHAALAAIHYSLISKGFKYVQAGEKFPADPPKIALSDMPPENWTEGQKCSLIYWNNAEGLHIMLKVFDMKSYAAAHIIKQGGSSITDCNVDYEFLGETFTTFTGTYKKPQELLTLIEKRLIVPSLSADVKKSPSPPKPPSPNDRFDVLFDPCKDTFSGSNQCPFCRKNKSDNEGILLPSGRCDLDPLGRSCTCGGGGMFFDPFRNVRPPGRPQHDDPSRIPSGSVPPGARFDPIRPPTSPRSPRSDPDEMKPPGSREHYF